MHEKININNIYIFILHCSFDNKSGIWKNSDTIDVKKTDRFKDFETLYTKEKSFNKIILPNKNLDLLLDPIIKTKKWSDEFYQKSNNFDNFAYENLNEIIFKSKKISRYKIKDKILFDGYYLNYLLDRNDMFFRVSEL